MDSERARNIATCATLGPFPAAIGAGLTDANHHCTDPEHATQQPDEAANKGVISSITRKASADAGP